MCDPQTANLLSRLLPADISMSSSESLTAADATDAASDSSSSAARQVLESPDLLCLIVDALPVAQVLSACRVSREWRATLRPPLSDEAASAPSACPAANHGGGGFRSAAAEAILSRYSLPDAIYPAELQRGGEGSVRARVAPESAMEHAAAATATVDASAPAAVPSPEPTDDIDASDVPLSYLHLRSSLDLSAAPASPSARAHLLRSFRHPLSRLRTLRLAGAAEQLAAPELLGLLHPHTLGQLEELSACACLVGPYLEEEPCVGLHPTLRRWSLSPAVNSPEYARQHPLERAGLARLLPLCRSLRTLSVAHSRLWDSSLQIIGDTLHHSLTALNLNFNVDITNAGLQTLDKCSGLRELQMQRLWKLTSQGVHVFFSALAQGYERRQADERGETAAASASGLAQGGTADSHAATSASSDATSSATPHPTCGLRLINLSEMRQRGHGCLMSLAPFCPLLEHAELSELSVSRETMRLLAQHCPSLRLVNLSRVGTAPLAEGPAAAPVPAAVEEPLVAFAARALFPLRAPAVAAVPAVAPAAAAPAPAAAPAAAAFVPPPMLLLHAGSSEELRVTDLSLGLLTRGCPGLRCLDLERARISDAGCSLLSRESLPLLEHLSLWQCEEIGDEGVMNLLGGDKARSIAASSHPSLAFILLPANPRSLSSAATSLLLEHCTALRHLLGYVPFSSVQQVRDLHVRHHSTLRSLSMHVVESRGRVAQSSRVDAAALRLLHSFSALECLDVTAPRLTNADLQGLLLSLGPHLRVLKLSQCDDITDEAFVWASLRAGSGEDASSGAAPVASAPAVRQKPSFGAFVAAQAASVPAGVSSSPATSSAATATASSPLASFSPESIGWSCVLQLVYLSSLSSISVRALQSLAQLPSVRYVDAAACAGLQRDERRVEQLQRQLRESSEQGQRHSVTIAVHEPVHADEE